MTERRDAVVALALFAAASAFLLSFRPFSRPLMLDPATWDYMSVEIARGMVPYRDVFLHKTPGAALLGAVGAATAARAGIEPVHGAHAVFLLLGATAPALLYLVCRRRLAPLAALACAVFFFAWDAWPLAAIEGVRPKVATVTLGLACLAMAERRRPLAAGIAGGAATLCWQPGVVFLLGALWAMRGVRPRSAWTALLFGAAAAWAAMLLWLSYHGALGSFVTDAVAFNLHYIEAGARPPWRTAGRIVRELWRWEPLACLLTLLAATICAHGGWRRVPESLTVVGLAYLALSFVSFQAWPDTILLLAPLATVAGAGLSQLDARLLRARQAGGLAATALALSLAAQPAAPRFRPPTDFTSQRQHMRALAAGLAATDRVIAVSVPEFLLHTGRRSGWPWPYLWFGLDRFVAKRTPGGFARLLAELETDPPALILIARRWNGPLRDRFETWAAVRYRRERARIYPHVRRPIAVYRLLHR